ncbi:MAG: cytochrome c oxidase assembly protein [Gammaproteobacteria bacterium]
MNMSVKNSNRTALKLFVVAMAMFGFGYALVPLYNVMCEIAGINGKTGTISSEEAGRLTVDSGRLVTVEFDTNVNGDLPWGFRPAVGKVKVQPGKVTDVIFVVENNTDREIVGQAIPSVAPHQASLYFKKTECFCFTQQTLAPRERKEMLVRFVVDSKLPGSISTLTLSYTFFPAPGEHKTAHQPENVESTADKNTNI